ncbi:hypothetical protein M406DRAFT_354233 [Cryphonectria parasitica EP155]|uniref:P-loop containing nucleoside triphosphate hydrolase protein n=1 Tax=Cryphonectria parasitica (strain ATCC 38755 / EP155) TaxID=660469 RepID=A0A9P4YBK5_CRYP1|nr:uncharacterized protein M406DRAFT_354233 [Cryphonectria parasitica EP155]KAF3770048.1 hypothetical protein M406DRAFT_354233 [Cryphonectria parasitica EP155]
MSNRPIFMATHPRACSTAFERVFMTRRDILQCAHEPFGDAFYYGPERLSDRFADDEDARIKSGFSKSTYKTVMDRLEKDGSEGKRVFIKDIAHYLLPPHGKDAEVAPSLVGGHALTDAPEVNSNADTNSHNGFVSSHTNGFVNGPTNGDASNDATTHTTGHVNGPTNDEDENPTVMPTDMLRGFHWTFLIRHPRRSIPSYYRCTVPPLDAITGFHDFMPSEAGYEELRQLFDYLLSQNIIGPKKAGDKIPVDEALNGSGSETSSLNEDAPRRAAITVIDADDLLQNPEAILKVYCEEVGIDYTPKMLEWGDEANQKYAADAFEKWYGFHHDAIESKCLKPRPHGHKTPTIEAENADWREKFGEEAAKVIRETVDANTADYEYLKSFAIKV